MNYSPEAIQKIDNAANLYDVLSEFVDFKRQGASFYAKCPMCHKEGKGKGLILTPAKKIYKCFNCDFKGGNPVKFLMEAQNKTYPQALEYLAEKFHVIIDEPTRFQKKSKPSKAKNAKSFRDKQLQESGLTNEDQKASVYIDEDTKSLVDIYETGTRNQYGQIEFGDDMIIWYYDLAGKPIMFQKPKANRFDHLFRIRWQNPDLHLDKEGRPIKYQSPVGSGSHIYIPELVRRAFQAKQHQKRLFIQEGEKKADKACKHGIFSIGIMGIHNIAYNKQLPYEIQLIIKTLNIKEVIFMVDGDWNSLSNTLKNGDPADQRPYSFFRAVVNFRDYFKTFTNIGIYLELYFGHILPEHNDKGIDDLLNNTLKGKEDTLLEDINAAINEKDGQGDYIQMHTITTVAESKLMELWFLDSAEKFAEHHREKLLTLTEFKINRLKWRFNKEGKLELAQPLMPEEIYWEIDEWEDRNGHKKKQSKFDPENAYNFLRNRGYARILMISGKYEFAFHENHIINIVEPWQIKDFIMDFSMEIAPKDVRNMLYRGGKMYFGPDSLSNIKFMFPEFDKPSRYNQNIYFKTKFWHVTANGIVEKSLTELDHHIWGDKINNFEAKLLTPIIDIVKITDEVLEQFKKDEEKLFWGNYKNYFFIEETKAAENCHFFQFIKNTGEFYWDKLTFDHNRQIIADNRSTSEKMETNLHLVSKMSGIGYLLHRYRNKSENKAVVGMDGKLSEVGSSNGRTGKSLVGFAISYVIPQVYIGGKNKNLTEDRFLLEEVNEKTCNLFFDDVRANFDFEFLFPLLGGRATIEKKAVGKITYPDDQTPKIYLTTNHAILGDGSSFKDRQFIMAFSDYYNDTYKPIHQFGIQFFEEWDNEQWNLFYNFMGLCLQVYLKYGLIEQPTERIEKRRLRQEIGEEFISWGDEYFCYEPDKKCQANTNNPILRKDLFDNFLERNQAFKKFYTPNAFKKKFKKWCIYNEVHFNPQRFDKMNRPGADDKSNGCEYFTVSNTDYKTE
jgi:DNA primase